MKKSKIFKELDTLCKNEIMLMDGPLGTMVQKYKLQEEDYRGDLLKNHSLDLKGNNEILNITRPNIIKEIHKSYINSGSKIIETNTFNGTTGIIDLPTKVYYKNEYSALSAAPAAATYTGYFFTVDGDDNPYVNINITAGGAGDVRAKVVTEYSSIGLLSDVDITTAAQTNNQVLKWNGTKFVPADDIQGTSGGATQNLFATIFGDSGSTTANTTTDSLTIAGGTDITLSLIHI